MRKERKHIFSLTPLNFSHSKSNSMASGSSLLPLITVEIKIPKGSTNYLGKWSDIRILGSNEVQDVID